MEIPGMLRKLLLVVAILTILMCPLLFIGAQFFPDSLGFLEPVICPSGMHLERVTETVADDEGYATASFLNCTDGREEVDITGRMLIILFGVGILGVILLVFWALAGPGEAPEEAQIAVE